MLTDADYQTVKVAIDTATNEIYENNKNGQNTLLFVYYAGHGMMDNYTYSVLNGGRRYKYPLEKMLRTAAKMNGSYIIAAFDCCREKLSKDLMRGGGG